MATATKHSAAAHEAHARLRAGFDAGLLRTPAARVAALRALRDALCASEEAALAALHADLGKQRVEAVVSEFAGLYMELKFFIDGLQPGGRLLTVGGGAAGKPTSIAVGETLAVEYVPRGVCLQIAPFNFPIMLALRPLIGAIAAGNCVLLKPSELVPECERFLADFVAKALDPRVCAVMTGDAEVATALLELRWDHITFTGGSTVGRIIAQAAARHLTPTLLELGGKNPTVVTASADVDNAAKGVSFARWMNSGQVCLANDYVLVEDCAYSSFVSALIATRKAWFEKDLCKSKPISSVVNKRAFDRITSMLDRSTGSILAGGERDEASCYIAPTIVELTLEQARDGDALMSCEIFGPVLVVCRVPDLATATSFISAREKPLALYVFGSNKAEVRQVLDSTDSGAACVNYAALHAICDKGWLGGIGESGMGGYGYAKSLETYSHQRQVYSIAPWRHRLLQKTSLIPAWTEADGSPNKSTELALRAYLDMPFEGSGGITPRDRISRFARLGSLILLPIVVGCAASVLGYRWT